jgi:hypothetical protein
MGSFGGILVSWWHIQWFLVAIELIILPPGYRLKFLRCVATPEMLLIHATFTR